MSCDWVKSQIILYLYNELDDPERVEIEQHTAGCTECAGAIAEERRLHQVLNSLERPEVDPNVLAASRIALSHALEEQPKRVLAGWSWWRSLGGWAVRAWLRPVWPSALAVMILAAGFISGFGYSAYRSRALAPEAAGPLQNISNISAINADPQGNLEITYDTTHRSVVRGSSRDPEIERLLLYAARNLSNPGIRLDSIDLLKGRAADQEIRAALIGALRADQNAGVRLKALGALQEFGADVNVKQALLETLMRDDNAGVRIQAVEQLGRLRDVSTVPVLQRLAAGDPNSYVRLRSASALRDLNAPEIY